MRKLFAFLPYCQLNNGNVVVDFFTQKTSRYTRGWMDMFNSAAYCFIAGLLTWRLALGGYDMWRFGETTMILGVQRWWGFIPVVASLALLTLVCAYNTRINWRKARA